MDKRTLFELWAPAANPWSPWAKPAPFVHLSGELAVAAPLPPRDLAVVPPAAERCAVVLDLPGAEAVAAALALAGRGYWPVPLFNACPAPPAGEGEVVKTAVDVGSTLQALVAAAPALAEAAVRLPVDAPPVFLLDVQRTETAAPLEPGIFDNRSVVFASDFPSPAFLQQHAIPRALLVHAGAKPPGDDLRHALRHWLAGGIALTAVMSDGPPLDVKWPGRGFFGELTVRLFALLRLQRNARGGFGAFVPESSGG